MWLSFHTNIKIAVVAFLIAITATGGYLSYTILRRHQEEMASSEFELYKVHIRESVNQHLNSVAAGTRAIASLYASECDRGYYWPNCLLKPHTVELEVNTVIDALIFSSYGFGPFINGSQQTDYENFYIKYYSGKVMTSQEGPGIFGFDRNSPFSDFRYLVRGLNDPEGQSETRLLAPLTQTNDPKLGRSLYGYDEYTELVRKRAIDTLLMCDSHDTFKRCTVMSDTLTFPSSLTDPTGMSPTALIYSSVKPLKYPAGPVRGYVVSPVRFNELLMESIPTDVSGLRASFYNNDTKYTYSLDDGIVKFKGRKPWTQSPRGDTIQSSLLSSGSQSFNIQITRTDQFDDNYMNDIPVMVCSVYLGMMIFLTVLFIVYDYVVNQKIIQSQIVVNTKQQFVRYISHEIRGPINTISVGVQLLLSEMEYILDDIENYDLATLSDIFTRSIQDWKTISHDIYSSCVSSTQVLNSILTYEKLKLNGSLNIEKTYFSVGQLMEKVVKQYRSVAKSKFISIKTKFMSDHLGFMPRDPSNPFSEIIVHGDQAKLEQVIGNLVFNSLKFTREGSITVKAWLENRRFETHTPDDNYFTSGFYISVTDTGIGVDPSDMWKLFSEGVQIDPAENQEGGGSGFGLYLCKKIINNHGGTIWAESEGKDKGTTVTFVIPGRHARSLPPHIIEKINNVGLEKKSERIKNIHQLRGDHVSIQILYVDDNFTNLKLVCRMLKKMGCQCDTAEDGIEGLRQVEERGSFDIVLTDDQMPNMSGSEMVSRLRQNGYNGVIIGLTGSADRDEVTQLLAAGCNQVLIKPLDETKIQVILQNLEIANQTKPVLLPHSL